MMRRPSAHRAERAAAHSAPTEPGLPANLGPFSLHPADPAHDRALLLAAYASSRADDLDLHARHPESRLAVIEHEFDSRQLCYAVDFPDVRFFILRHLGSPAGRLYLQSTAADLFIVDLVLLPELRGMGHGTALMCDLIAHGRTSGRPVRLHVAKSNPRAAALYHRLGFHHAAELQHHHLLEHSPTPQTSPAP